MRSKNTMWRLIPAAVAVAGLMGAMGCQEQQRRTETREPAATKPEARNGRCTAYRPTVPAGSNATVMYFPTGSAESSAVAVHQIMPSNVRVGQEFSYDVHVTNLTSNTLQNVVLTSENANNLQILRAEPAAAGGRNGGGEQWIIGDLAPCQTQVVHMTAKAGKIGTAANCVSVAYANLLCASTNVVQPALTVTKTITPADITMCDAAMMRIEVKNTGTGEAANVRVRDTLPAGLTTADGKTSLELDAGTLAAGQSKFFETQIKGTKTGKFDNKATASAAGDLTAESEVASLTVHQPVLTVEAACERGTILPGRQTTCRFTVKNTGDSPSANTIVTAPISGSFVAADNGGVQNAGNVTWNLGTLAPGASKTVSLTVRNTGANIACSASARGDCAAQVTDSCNVVVQGVPDIGTLVTDLEGVVLVGSPHPYTLEVQNQGQVPLTNVKMVLTLPEGLEFVSSDVNPQAAGGKLTFDLGTLAPGVAKRWTVTVKANRAGEYLVVGETTSTETKFPVRDDEYTNFVAP